MNNNQITKKINWELIIGLISLLLAGYTFYIGEKRNTENKSKEELEQTKLEQTFNLTKQVTFGKLLEYKTLIHAKRSKEYYELYYSLNNLMADSVEFIDASFTEMIYNHTTKLQLWTSRINNDNLKVTSEQLNQENHELLNINKNLYTTLCTKYRFELDSSFFENCFFY